ncbi:hypothetical protein [Candidatus Poriferisodalis sp.]|uniref:hypothetical protein n=1 Tax=Candidatus Poriferisodalis sp. TaxID=3101277 RepID=UPI003B01BA70
MELSVEIRQRLERLNIELQDEANSPTVKYFALQADYDFDGEWIALITLQLDEPEDGEWRPARLEDYRERIWDAVGDIVTPDCLFRTPEEMREIEHQRGENLSTAPPPRPPRRASGLAR